MRILLKILEPLYPLLQKYKEDLNSNSNYSEPITESDSQVTDTDQSETFNGVESTNGKSESVSKGINNMDQTDQEEYRKFNTLYEVLSNFLMDYCRILFKVCIYGIVLLRPSFYNFLIYEKIFKILESGGRNKNKIHKIVQSIKIKPTFFLFIFRSHFFSFKLTLKDCARQYLLVGFQ